MARDDDDPFDETIQRHDFDPIEIRICYLVYSVSTHTSTVQHKCLLSCVCYEKHLCREITALSRAALAKAVRHVMLSGAAHLCVCRCVTLAGS